MARNNLQERVAALEAELAELKKRLSQNEKGKPWWEKISGTFLNDPMYEDAMKLGRKYRESTRPKKKRK